MTYANTFPVFITGLTPLKSGENWAVTMYCPVLIFMGIDNFHFHFLLFWGKGFNGFLSRNKTAFLSQTLTLVPLAERTTLKLKIVLNHFSTMFNVLGISLTHFLLKLIRIWQCVLDQENEEQFSHLTFKLCCYSSTLYSVLDYVDQILVVDSINLPLIVIKPNCIYQRGFKHQDQSQISQIYTCYSRCAPSQRAWSLSPFVYKHLQVLSLIISRVGTQWEGIK